MTEKQRGNQLQKRLFRALYRIRRVEEEIARVYPTDKIKSPVHLSIGQESVSVGVCDAMRADDVAFGTYRGHALYLAKGGDLKRMIAELYGKRTGCARGKAGSMHLADVAAGMMGTSAVVSTAIPQAVGYAFALKAKGDSRIVATFFGDGATEEGVFHESMNFAALKKLPLLLVCENNLYAIHSHIKDRIAGDGLRRRAESYGVPAVRIDDGDVFKIREEATRAINAIRVEKAGPCFLECMTYRWREHVGPGEDWHLGYRSKSECEKWLKNDQVVQVGATLDQLTRKGIEVEVDREIERAFEFAERSDFPEAEELYEDVFSG